MKTQHRKKKKTYGKFGWIRKNKVIGRSRIARITSDLETGHRNELEKSFDETFTKLKLAQSNLKKTIDHYKDAKSKKKTANNVHVDDIECGTSTELVENVSFPTMRWTFLRLR